MTRKIWFQLVHTWAFLKLGTGCGGCSSVSITTSATASSMPMSIATTSDITSFGPFGPVDESTEGIFSHKHSCQSDFFSDIIGGTLKKHYKI